MGVTVGRQEDLAVGVSRVQLSAVVAVAGGVAALVLVHLVLADTYWDFSEGVYALSSHLWLHGRELYDGLIGAQPPGVFLVGAGIELLHNGLEWLRLGVGALQLISGLIAATIVYRQTGSRAGAAVTPAAALLTPWAVHEHGALLPETVALPFLLGALATSSDPRRAPVFGVLCGIAPVIKVPLALPAVVIVLLAADPRRSARWAVATAAAGVAATALVGGTGAWRDVVSAQAQVGLTSTSALASYWTQAGWNLVGLVLPAAVAVYHRARLLDARLFRVQVGFALAMLLTVLTTIKAGTWLQVLVPVEAALLPLAICGVVLAARTSRLQLAGCILALLFVLAQSVSLLASPTDPRPFARPGSHGWLAPPPDPPFLQRPSRGLGAALTGSEFRASVALARACPRNKPYSGSPLVAFAAGRTVPADQPDHFLITNAPILRRFRLQVQAAIASGTCP